ncbi:Rossmann-fold NAD(P)-binding domain-containing protein [Cyclobacterium marinum]|uniref:epimerase n=1 Tax=Cyclobacterium marinum TaxID=104 RepID=UPI0011EE62D0|nr:epimerase [Cyclobacterium marinum]MBI0397448.1 epimerase [Cyclobacterium marinum]
MKIIITGASGMVGQAALIESLDSPTVSEILIINRKSIELKHPKLKELLIADYSEIPFHTDKFIGYDGCLHCMGISAVGIDEIDYTKITFGYSKILFDSLLKINPDMKIIYVSGAGTDSTEKGNYMWARIKGKTENYLLNLGFKDAYAFRPGIILPEKGVKSKTAWYNAMYSILRPVFPLIKKMKGTIGSSDLGKAMLSLLKKPIALKIIDPLQIKNLAKNFTENDL